MRAVPLVLAVIVAVAISVLRTRDQEDDRRRLVATDQTAELLRITDPAQAAGEFPWPGSDSVLISLAPFVRREPQA